MESLSEITGLMSNVTEKDRELIGGAYHFAEKAHADQKRYSGESYFHSHVVEVAKNIARLGMDGKTIAAGLLHDTLEDGRVTEDDIKKEFGDEILSLVSGVTKLGKLKYRGLHRHVESLRKFFIAVAEDIRVVIIKLADRLHNVSTLEHVPEHKRKRIALETLEIYAPIADRLGIGKLKGELEDGAFKYAYPGEYETIIALTKEMRGAAEEYLEKFYKSLVKTLGQNGIKKTEVDRRVKHLYSFYKKWLRHDRDAEKIYDLVALRVVVPNIDDCYKVLGIIHGTWRPLPGRIKDYIALPKQNGYQSIHTTVFTGDGGIVEIQIRTKEMHEAAEYGIASHLAYKAKNSKREKEGLSKNISWIQELLELQHEVKKGEYLDRLKTAFFEHRVFVFTPKGDVIDLPEGSSPVDFAYAIHSDIGDHLSAAKVNNRMVSLETKLKNGDIVEIVTKDSSRPSSKWLEYVKTTIAKKRIKSEVQKLESLKRFFK